MADSKGPYDNAAAMRRKYALHLLQQASDASPVKHPLQALARALQGGFGGYYAGLDREDLSKSDVGAAAPPAAAAGDDQARAGIVPDAGQTVPLPRPRPLTAPAAGSLPMSFPPAMWPTPSLPTPSPDAINFLKRYPELQTQFDEKYGAGAAARARGGQ